METLIFAEPTMDIVSVLNSLGFEGVTANHFGQFAFTQVELDTWKVQVSEGKVRLENSRANFRSNQNLGDWFLEIRHTKHGIYGIGVGVWGQCATITMTAMFNQSEGKVTIPYTDLHALLALVSEQTGHATKSVLDLVAGGYAGITHISDDFKSLKVTPTIAAWVKAPAVANQTIITKARYICGVFDSMLYHAKDTFAGIAEAEGITKKLRMSMAEAILILVAHAYGLPVREDDTLEGLTDANNMIALMDIATNTHEAWWLGYRLNNGPEAEAWMGRLCAKVEETHAALNTALAGII